MTTRTLTLGIYIYFSNQTWEVDFSANFNIVLSKKTNGCSVQVDVYKTKHSFVESYGNAMNCVL